MREARGENRRLSPRGRQGQARKHVLNRAFTFTCRFARTSARTAISPSGRYGGGRERYLEALAPRSPPPRAFPRTGCSSAAGRPTRTTPATLAERWSAVRERFELPRDAEVSGRSESRSARCCGELRGVRGRRASTGSRSACSRSCGRTRDVLGRRHAPADVAVAVARGPRGRLRQPLARSDVRDAGPERGKLARIARPRARARTDHISTYGLTVEDGTPYRALVARSPGAFSTRSRSRTLRARDRHARAPASSTTRSATSRGPGCAARTTRTIGETASTCGFGVGAASYPGRVRSTPHARSRRVLQRGAGRRDRSRREERLERRARVGEAAMLALRTLEGVDVAAFAERYEVDFSLFYAGVSPKCGAGHARRRAGARPLDASGAASWPTTCAVRS